MFCGNCGVELREGARFCPKCGTKAREVPASGKLAESNIEQKQEPVVEPPIEQIEEIAPEVAPVVEVQEPQAVPVEQIVKSVRVVKAAPTVANKQKPIVRLKAVTPAPVAKEIGPKQEKQPTPAKEKTQNNLVDTISAKNNNAAVESAAQPSAIRTGAAYIAAAAGGIKEAWDKTRVHCESCGARLKSGVKFCPQCGKPTGLPDKRPIDIQSKIQESGAKAVEVASKAGAIVASKLGQRKEVAGERVEPKPQKHTSEKFEDVKEKKKKVALIAVCLIVFAFFIGGCISWLCSQDQKMLSNEHSNTTTNKSDFNGDDINSFLNSNSKSEEWAGYKVIGTDEYGHGWLYLDPEYIAPLYKLNQKSLAEAKTWVEENKARYASLVQDDADIFSEEAEAVLVENTALMHHVWGIPVGIITMEELNPDNTVNWYREEIKLDNSGDKLVTLVLTEKENMYFVQEGYLGGEGIGKREDFNKILTDTLDNIDVAACEKDILEMYEELTQWLASCYPTLKPSQDDEIALGEWICYQSDWPNQNVVFPGRKLTIHSVDGNTVTFSAEFKEDDKEIEIGPITIALIDPAVYWENPVGTAPPYWMPYAYFNYTDPWGNEYESAFTWDGTQISIDTLEIIKYGLADSSLGTVQASDTFWFDFSGYYPIEKVMPS